MEVFYRRVFEFGYEGFMVKRFDFIYELGNRGKKWFKIKFMMENFDFVIIGVEWGEGRRVYLFGLFFCCL